MPDFERGARVALGLEEPQHVTDARRGLYGGILEKPDSAAKVFDLSTRTGIPRDVVGRNMDEVQRRARMEDIARQVQDTPTLAQWLSDQNNAAMAHDNVENMGEIERTVRNLGRAGVAGLQGASAGVVGMVQAPVDLLSPLLDPLAGTVLPENPLRRVGAGLSQYRKSIETQSKAMMPRGEGVVERGVYSGVGSLARNIAALPLALLPGGQTAALTAMTAPVFGQEFGQATDKGMRPFNAAVYGASQAAIEYATEKIPVSRLIGDLSANVGFGKLLARQLAAEIPGEQVATILQDLNEWAALKPNAPFSEYLKERPSAAAETLIATIVGVGGQTTLMRGLDAVVNHAERKAMKAQQGTQDAQTLEAVTNLMAGDKLLQRSPEAFADFARKAAQASGSNTVYIDANALMQSGVAPQVAQLSESVAQQLETAQATGGTIAIPLEEYMSKIAPSEVAKSIIGDLRVDPNGFTFKEAQEWEASKEKAFDEEVEKVLKAREDDAEFKASRDALKEKLLQELNAVGRFTTEKNEADAMAFASYYAVRAAQLGMTPEALYEQRKVRFAAQAVPGQQLEQSYADDPARWEFLTDRHATLAPPVAVVERDSVVYEYRDRDAENPFSTPTVTALKDGRVIGTLAIAEKGNNSVGVVQVKPEERRRGVASSMYQFAEATTGRVFVPDNNNSADAQAMWAARNGRFGEDTGGTLNQSAQDQTETEAFRKWFGDSVVTEDGKPGGKPLVVYHGTRADFTEFSRDFAGDGMSGEARDGFFFTSDPAEASDYAGGTEPGGRVMPVYVALKRPMVLEFAEHGISNVIDDDAAVAAMLRKSQSVLARVKGIDGLMLKDIGGVKGKHLVVAFRPEQIKSATGNRGTFDPNDPNILHQSAYHGTPHRFDKFSTEKIGTGEGAQAYGWGLYFASKREIAEHYRKALTISSPDALQKHAIDAGLSPELADTMAQFYAGARSSSFDDFAALVNDKSPSEYIELFREKYLRPAIADGSAKKAWDSFRQAGQLYEVEIPEDSEMLLWDKPLSEQPAKVREALDDFAYKHNQGEVDTKQSEAISTLMDDAYEDKAMTGRDLYEKLAYALGDRVRNTYNIEPNQKTASEALAALGIKGIKYLDGGSRAAGDGSYNYVVFSGDDVAIKNQFYQQARGSFSPDSFTITMLAGADLSTVLHEGAHFFFENDIGLAAEIVSEGRSFGVDLLTEGQKEILADVSTLMKWHGIEGTIEEQLATWYGMDFEKKRVAHERTAESFERYLISGKAPSVDLQPYFQKFRAWLLNVYQSIKKFLERFPESQKLDDEVRSVFDRMLATTEQIRFAEQSRSMLPLFENAEQAGMTKEEFATYHAQTMVPTGEAIDELQARGMRDVKWVQNAKARELRRLQKEAKALRSQTRMEVRRDVLTQPVYRAWQFLTGRMTKGDKAAVKTEQRKQVKGLDPENDSLFVAIAKLGGLNKEAVVKAWGWDGRTPVPVFGMPLLRKEGKSIDAMGEALAEVGYLGLDEDGRYDLAELEEKFDEELRGKLQYSIARQYAREGLAGDTADLEIVRSGRLEKFSLGGFDPEIVASLEARGMVDVDGFHPDVLADSFGFSSGDEMVRALSEAQDMNTLIEARTDELMMERHADLATPEAVDEAADLAIHNRARARMVATEANALAKVTGSPRLITEVAQDFARTIVGKIQIRSLSVGRFANAAAKAGANAAKHMASGDAASAGVEKRNQALQLMAAEEAKNARREFADLRKAWSKLANKPDDRLKGYDLDVVNVIRSILSEYGIAEKRGVRAKDYVSKLEAYDPEVFKWVSASLDAARENAKPFEELTVDEARGLADEVENLLYLARNMKTAEVGGVRQDREELVETLRNQLQKVGIPETRPGRTSAVTDAERRSSKFLTAIAALRRAEEWAIGLDIDKKGGPFFSIVFSPVKDAADRFRAEKAERVKQFRDLFETIRPTMKPGKIFDKDLNYTFGETGSALNEILHAIAHTGNASNKRKLLLGRGWATELEGGDLDTRKWDAFIARMAKEGVLKKEHFDFVQSLWDMMESMKPAAQKAHRESFGKYFDEITAEPVQTPFGVYKGGYLPAIVDSMAETDGALKKLQEEENAGMSYVFPATPSGFTKSRTEYNKTLLLDLRSIPQHIEKVLLFTHMTGPVRQTRAILQQLGDEVEQVTPGALGGMLTPWLKRSALQRVESPIPGDPGAMRFFTWLRTKTGMAAMMGNVINALQQVTGFSIASTLVRPKYLLGAQAEQVKSPKEFNAFVSESSLYMKDRLSNEMGGVFDDINEILLNPNLLEKGQAWTQRHAYFLQHAFDVWMSPVVWKGAYDQAREEGMEHDDAVKQGDSAVRRTQGTQFAEDVSRIETGNAFIRLFTQFASYFNMQANMMGTQFKQIARGVGLKNGMGRGFYVMLFAFMVPAIAAEMIVQAFRGVDDEDDDGEWLDDWLASVFFFAPLKNATAMVPGVGQLVNAGLARFNDKPYDDRISTSPVLSMLETTMRAPFSVAAAFEDGDRKKAVKDLGTAISITLGLPGGLVARPLGYLAGVEQGTITPTSELDFARGVVTGVASPDSR